MYKLEQINKNIQEIIDYVKAIDQGDLTKVQAYIENNKVNINDNLILPFLELVEFSPPLVRSCGKEGKKEVVRYLLEKGAKPNDGITAAAESGRLDLLKILLETPGVNINDSTHDLPIVRASFNGHSDVVQFLIDKGADVNAKGYQGNLALTAALLKVNATVHFNNKDHNKYVKIAKLLIKHGANIQEDEEFIVEYLNNIPENIMQENIIIENLIARNDQQEKNLWMPSTLTIETHNEISQSKEPAAEELVKFLGDL